MAIEVLVLSRRKIGQLFCREYRIDEARFGGSRNVCMNVQLNVRDHLIFNLGHGEHPAY
jgi:hypothetical protein